MACNCNKCNTSKKCGCNDSALTTPCTYSDCGVGSERCSDVQCAECVSYCGTTFEIGNTNNLIKIETGERLDSIIQKLALMISQGVCSTCCTSDDLHHAPYNVFANGITSTSAIIQWNNISTATQTFSVEYYDVAVGLPWLSATTGLTNSTSSYILSSLTASKSYKVRIVSTDSVPSNCTSVIITFSTLA